MEKESKALLEKVVDLAVDVLMSRDSDAGWQHSGVLGRAQETGGILSTSGDVSLSVWKKSLLLGNWSSRHYKAVELLQTLSESNREALILHRAYLNRTKAVIDPQTGKRSEIKWTADMIARELGISPASFRQRVYRAYLHLAEVLGLVGSAS